MTFLSKHKKLILVVLLVSIIIVVFVVLCHSLFLTSRQSLYFKINNAKENYSDQVAVIMLALPTKENFKVGDKIDVFLLVNSTDQAINAVAGSITFPNDKLKMIDTSKDNSIVNLWIKEPSLNDSGNAIDFSGVMISHSFTGKAGQILTASFKVIAGGEAMIDIKNTQVLADDGLGTDILTSVIPSSLTLVPPSVPKGKCDINEDGKVNLSDIFVLISHLGSSNDSRFNFNGDNKVDIKDLSILISNLGKK
jgi:hypothetical protein